MMTIYLTGNHVLDQYWGQPRFQGLSSSHSLLWEDERPWERGCIGELKQQRWQRQQKCHLKINIWEKVTILLLVSPN